MNIALSPGLKPRQTGSSNSNELLGQIGLQLFIMLLNQFPTWCALFTKLFEAYSIALLEFWFKGSISM